MLVHPYPISSNDHYDPPISTKNDDRSAPADIVVKLILQVDEAVVAGLCEGDISQNSSNNDGTNRVSLRYAFQHCQKREKNSIIVSIQHNSKENAK
jgi:hypothetical protein